VSDTKTDSGPFAGSGDGGGAEKETTRASEGREETSLPQGNQGQVSTSRERKKRHQGKTTADGTRFAFSDKDNRKVI